MHDAGRSLRLTLSAGPVSDPSRRFAVTASFTNISSGNVRLLKLFDPLPVFFTASLTRVEGGEIDVAGAGKADPFEGSMIYHDLAPGESLAVTLDLAPWIRGPMRAGQHHLSLTYHNAYGADCVHGPLDSPPITVPVEGVR